jgi:hypothetical protein
VTYRIFPLLYGKNCIFKIINAIYLWVIYIYKIKSKRNEQISEVSQLFLLVRRNLVFYEGSQKNQTTYLQYQRRFSHIFNLSRIIKPTCAHTIKVVKYYWKSTSTNMPEKSNRTTRSTMLGVESINHHCRGLSSQDNIARTIILVQPWKEVQNWSCEARSQVPYLEKI